ncbi:hypothetical protein F7731_09490 [Cytobacillus depressus]|uniref:Uncharacterized protein n=1 Tax=Cytobacillus depressus TaxID=1602942 RepID=A0A6L3V5S9_9BACI|nr:hypothetical protein [Cytobacillus depressus]KAB2336589.1 hypothetical protein F7731_09490 [Cytobacillus depressus]
MKNSNLAFYFWKILWLLGLIVLGNVCLNFRNQVEQTSRETFDMIPFVWVESLIPFIFGLYISLLFVKKWTFNINPSLLWCVSIPCIIFSFGLPLSVSFSVLKVFPEELAISINFWLLNISSLGVLGIVAGLTLILSFFNTHSNNEMQ